MSDKTFTDGSLEIRVSGVSAVVHDKVADKYYQAPASSLPASLVAQLEPYVPGVGAALALTLLAAGIILLIVNMIACQILPVAGTSVNAMLVFFAYAGGNVAFHEGAHVLALSCLGRRIDKVGFKMHYVIFPALYVRMNQSHMLNRYERIFVHGAGTFLNLVINSTLVLINFAFLRSSDVALATKFVGLTIVMNALPVLNSDGYRVLLALAGRAENKEPKRNPPWVRGLKISSIVLATAYGARMIYAMVAGF